MRISDVFVTIINVNGLNSLKKRASSSRLKQKTKYICCRESYSDVSLILKIKSVKVVNNKKRILKKAFNSASCYSIYNSSKI